MAFDKAHCGKPVRVEKSPGGWVIRYTCDRCGYYETYWWDGRKA